MLRTARYTSIADAFTGVDAYEIGTEWGVNTGCGTEVPVAQLDQLFASLPPNSLVRFWAFQGSMATNVVTHQLDWAPLDRVFAEATLHHQRLIPVITDQSGDCDGGNWKGPQWYDGGFTQVSDDEVLSCMGARPAPSSAPA